MGVPVVVWKEESGKWHAAAFGERKSSGKLGDLRKAVVKLAHEGNEERVGKWFDAAAKRAKNPKSKE